LRCQACSRHRFELLDNSAYKEFLGRLQKLRVALHKAKHKAVAERIRDVLATGQKVIVFTAFTDGLKKNTKRRSARRALP
jgi:hypothetical protein